MSTTLSTNETPEQALIRRALALSYFTVAYNVAEGLASIFFGEWTGSAALVGFGVDSFVEAVSAAVLIWRFSGHEGHSEHESSRRERKAVRLVGVALLMLAGYVIYEAVTRLFFREPPDESIAGLVIACLSLAVMLPLFLWKQRLGQQMGSRSVVTDAKQTLACMLLSVALLTGVGLHQFAGWWQADPIAGLVIAAFLVREAFHAMRDEELCCAAH